MVDGKRPRVCRRATAAVGGDGCPLRNDRHRRRSARNMSFLLTELKGGSPPVTRCRPWSNQGFLPARLTEPIVID